MYNQQKKTILALLKTDETNRNYQRNYWFPYKEFLDPKDNFTTFSCDNLDRKQKYIAVIENLLSIDETANIFVEVYGFEDGKEPFIYADTLIIFSKLSLTEIKQIFNEPKDIFPSDIGEKTEFSQPTFLIGDNGELIPIVKLLDNDYFVYYCWWD